MLLLFLGLVGLAIWIVRLVARLNLFELRLGQFERRNERDFADVSAVRALAARVAELEARARAGGPPTPDRPVVRVAPPLNIDTPPAATPAPVVAVPFPVAVAPPVVPLSAPAAAVHTEPAAPASDDAWEVTVGANWLNKAGVLVFVIGLALLVGYSMAHVGPAGRIAIGYVVSLTLLVGGVVLERRADDRIFAHGLMAGGWAGTYFTTYAMRAVDAARVLDSDLVAIVCLLAVAAGMVWHSLRYRSQELTALAYIVAYATLALTPLRGFSLVASVPLALSVLVVAQRFAWPGVQILGLVCTYGLYILRGQVFGFGDLDPATFTPYAALAVYWVLFEVADLANLLGRTASRPAPAPLFLLNAAGLIGAALLQLPMDTPIPLSTFLVIAGVAYVASAIVRARLAGPSAAGADALDAAARGSYQGASVLAAAFVAWAIELRFAGTQRTVALLMEAELLFLSGLILRDWLIRGLGSAVALAVGLHAIWAIGEPAVAAPAWTWAAQGVAGAAALTAALWYANREALRSHQIPPLPHEWVYTPVATWLMVLIARADLPDGYSALAVLLFALPLLEAGVRRGREYLFQSYVAGGASALVLLGWFVSQAFFTSEPTERDAWFILSASAAAAYAAAWRLVPRVVAAATAEALGTAFIVVLQSIVIAPEYVAMAWAGTAAAIGAAGLWYKVRGLRWQAYPLLFLALFRAMGPILDPAAATAAELASALVVIGLLYAGSLAVRGALTHATKAVAELEDSVRMALSIAASLALTALISAEMRPNVITVTWGVQGAALLAAGFPSGERLLRLSGLAVLLACIVRLFTFDLPQLEALARIISFVVLGVVLLAVSWVYTRYRTRIQKYL